MFRNFLTDIFFPPRCLACGAHLARGVICVSCFAGIPRFTRISRERQYLIGAATRYETAAVKTLIHYLKFRGVRRAAEPLAELIARYMDDIKLDAGNFILIPVPLSLRRKNERGFNQAEEIARYLARRISITVRPDLLVRSRNTKPQTETTDLAERRRNVVDCFFAAHPEELRGRKVIILDDVTTSGATMGDAARAVKTAGARRVICIAAAKA